MRRHGGKSLPRAVSKNIGYEILSCDRTLLLLLTDSSDRVEAVRALNDLV